MMILLGFEDKSGDIIDKVIADIEGDKLMAEVFTKNVIYQAEITPHQCAPYTIQQFQHYLQNF
jgi:hypothetical protein